MNYIGKVLIQKALPRLLKTDKHKLLSLLKFLEKLASLSKFKLFGNVLLTDGSHPFLKVIERFLSEINPVCKEKIFKNLFLKLKSNSKNITPPTIFISLTSKCNLHCTGCSAHKEEPHDLEPALIEWIISDAKNKGTKLFILSGGEPFLRNDILLFLERHKDTYFQIFTNGTLIDDVIAESLSKVGNALILFSLEGRSEDTDQRRGDDVFKKITNSMSLLKERGVLFGVSILVTPYNFDTVTSKDFIEEMIKRGVFFAWYLTYKPVGDKLDLTLLIPPIQRHLLSEKIIEIRNAFPIIAIDHENDVFPIGGCLATNGIGIHINAKGGIEPCGILHYYDTFIREGEAIEDSLKKSKLLKEIKSLYSRSTSCPLIDQPFELSELIKRAFPETYDTFTDFKFLEEYIKTHRCQERIFSNAKEDLYTHLAEYTLKTAYSSSLSNRVIEK